jgi:hypothetical protein
MTYLFYTTRICSHFITTYTNIDSGSDCDDAAISNPGDKYTNQPEKGLFFHAEFIQGYDDGFNSCGGGGLDFDQGFSPPEQPRRGGIDWWSICNSPIVDAVIGEPCSTLVTPDGYGLTSEGERVLFCIVGGAALYAIAPAAGEMARRLGPSGGCG